jgi:hypothetical protein
MAPTHWTRAKTAGPCAASDCQRLIRRGERIGKIYDVAQPGQAAWAHFGCVHRYARTRSAVGGGTTAWFGVTSPSALLDFAMALLGAKPRPDHDGGEPMWRDQQLGVLKFALKRHASITLDKLTLAIMRAADGQHHIRQDNPMPDLIGVVREHFYYTPQQLTVSYMEQLASVVQGQLIRAGLQQDDAFERLLVLKRLNLPEQIEWFSAWRLQNPGGPPELTWFDGVLSFLKNDEQRMTAVETPDVVELSPTGANTQTIVEIPF